MSFTQLVDTDRKADTVSTMDEGKKHKRLRRSFTDEFTLLALAKRQDVVAARPGRRSNASARGQDSVDRARMLSECSPDFAQRLPASPPRPQLLLLSRRQAGPTASCHRATPRGRSYHALR